MKNVTLLLTGTVSPQGMTLTDLVDPEVRRSQYVESLNFWLEETDLPILFVENSGSAISNQIDNKYKGRVEFLTFDGNHTKHRGKGYGEFNCLKHAVDHSTFLKKSDFIFKITGRLKVMNFERFYQYYQRNSNAFVLADLQKNLRWADSRIFGCNPDFLTNYLIKRQEELDDHKGRTFEFILAKAIHEAIINELSFDQFPFYPEYVGVSGSENLTYKSGYLYFYAKHLQFYLKKRLLEK